MPQNIPSIDDIAGQPTKVAELDIEAIAILIDDAKAASSRATSVSRMLQGEVETRYKDQIAAAYLAKGEDTGAVHLPIDGFDIEVGRTKKVEWSQDDLAALRDQIKAANDNPDDYIEVNLTVPERKFTAWPESIQAKFADARTVKPGNVSIKIARVA